MQRLLLTSVTTLLMAGAAHSTDCTKGLIAMREVTSVQSNTENRTRLVNSLFSDKYRSWADLEKADASGTLGFPLRDIPVTIEGKNAKQSQQFEEWRELLRQYVSTASYDTWAYKAQWDRVTDGAVRAFMACLQEPGLHFWLERDSVDPLQVTMRGKYVTVDAQHPTLKIKKLTVKATSKSKPAAIDCIRGALVPGNPIGPPVIEGTCTLEDQTATVVAVLEADGNANNGISPGVPLCVPTAVTQRQSCPYPQGGAQDFSLRSCIGGDPNKSSRVLLESGCKPSECRNARDVTKLLMTAMWGIPEASLSSAEVDAWAAKLPTQSTALGLMFSMAGDDRWYRKVTAKDTADAGGVSSNPDLCVELAKSVRMGIGMDVEGLDTYRWIGLRWDPTVAAFGGGFGARCIFSHQRELAHLAHIQSHPSRNTLLGISGEDQIPPRLIGGQVIRYGICPGQ